MINLFEYLFSLIITIDNRNINISFFSFLLLFLLLSERIFFVNLPEFTICWDLLYLPSLTLFQITKSSLGSLMKGSQLSLEYSIAYLEVTKSLFVSIKHEKATSQIIHCCRSIYRFNSKQGLSNLSSFEESSS